MKKKLQLLLSALLVLLLLAGFTAPATAQQEQPVVRAVMFWMDTCPHCHYVLENVLPPLQDTYGDQFDILLLQITTQQEFDQFARVVQATGLSSQNAVVPFLLIGDSVLLGSQQIETQLPELIAQHLADGGVDYPQYDALTPFLPAPSSDTGAQSQNYGATPANASAVDGYYLALGLLIAMTLSLLYVGLVLARLVSPPPATLARLIPFLAFAGLLVAAYLAYVETQAVEAVCGPVGDCNAVQTSSYAYLFGVPLGVIGAGGYLVILGLWAWMRRGASIAAPLLLGASIFGLLFSIYLTYLEPFVIRAVCAWCLASAAIMALLAIASLRPVVEQRAPSRRRRTSTRKV
ncbi:MAG: vitamin K epoxide reductase family protein, partial [Chloroflexota bacterium]